MKAMWMTVAIALSLSSVACGGAVGKCKDACEDLVACDEDDFLYEESEELCEKKCDIDYDKAKDADCKTEYDDLVTCGEDNVTCDGEKIRENCSKESEAYDKCIE